MSIIFLKERGVVNMECCFITTGEFIQGTVIIILNLILKKSRKPCIQVWMMTMAPHLYGQFTIST